MYCSKCGATVAEGAAFCSACGQPATDALSNPASESPVPRVAARATGAYAGFWLRVVAYIIDSMALAIVVAIVILAPLMGRPGGGIPADDPWILYTGVGRQFTALRLLVVMASWLYWAVMESSSWQATLGKKALGLAVTDLGGNRISFARASGRFFGKILSWLTLLIGFAMAGFTEKKQALHDMLAGCLVIRKV